MSVYLKDEMVLVDGGAVATNEACCCGVGCPRDDFICAAFSNITACICITVNSNGYGFTDISLNGLFTLTKILDLPDLVQWEGFGGDIQFKKFSGAGCPGDPIEECDSTGSIVVQCRRDTEGNLLHTVTYSIEHFDVCISGWGATQAQIFRLNDAAGPLEFGIIENTETGCGNTGTGSGIAELGVVTVNSGGC